MIMKRFFSLTLGLLAAMASQAADTIYTKAPQIPILLERNDNVLFYMRMDAKDTKTLDEVTVTFDKNVPLSAIKSVKLYYSGTEAPQPWPPTRLTPSRKTNASQPVIP